MKALLSTLFLKYAPIVINKNISKVDKELWDILNKSQVDLLIIPKIKIKGKLIKIRLYSFFKNSNKCFFSKSYYCDVKSLTNENLQFILRNYFFELYKIPNFIPDNWKKKQSYKNFIVLDTIKENDKLTFYWGRTSETRAYRLYINDVIEYKGPRTNFTLENYKDYDRINAFVQTIPNCPCKPNVSSKRIYLPFHEEQVDFLYPLAYDKIEELKEISWVANKISKDTYFILYLDDKPIYKGKRMHIAFTEKLESGRHKLKITKTTDDNESNELYLSIDFFIEE